jgi:predicted DNA-binding protein (MmcQ/YjbR family)
MNHDVALERLRGICLPLPEVGEASTFGHPTFRAGRKSFAVLEPWQGELTLALRVGYDRQAELLEDDRFFETPYCGHLGWVSLRLDPRTDWHEVGDMVHQAYRTVALKRMLRALDGPSPEPKS